MRALLFMGGVFSAFMISIGLIAKNDAGNALGNASIVAGILIAVFVSAIWIISKVKEKREKETSDSLK